MRLLGRPVHGQGNFPEQSPPRLGRVVAPHGLHAIDAPPRQIVQADAVAIAAQGIDAQGPLLPSGSTSVNRALRSPRATGRTSPFSLSTFHAVSVSDNTLRAM